MGFRRRVEAGFVRWGRWVVRRRRRVIAGALLATFALGSLLPGLRVDNSEDAFLHPGDPERVRYDRFREIFDRDDRLVVLLRPREIFAPGFLATLREMQRAIEREVPYVEEVISLVNARDTRGEGDELVVDELMARWPETPEQIAALRARVFANPLYVGSLISRDSQYTVLSIKPFTWSTRSARGDVLAGFQPDAEGADSKPRLLTDAESAELLAALQRVLARYKDAGIELQVAGGSILDAALTGAMQRDVSIFLPLSLLVIVGLLVILFRSAWGVLLPVCVVVVSLISTFGVMVLLDIPFSISLNILPAFLLVVGVSDSIHLLAIVRQRLARGDARDEAIVGALGHAGLAVVMTSLTTAAGLASFVTAELAPIAHLGVIAPIGVMIALVYSLTLLPALVAVWPLGSVTAAIQRGTDLRGGRLERLLTGIGDAACRRPVAVLVATALLALLCSGGLLRVRFSHDAIRWFPEDDPVRMSAETLDRVFGGASALEVLVDSGSENGLHDPDKLARLEAAAQHAKGLELAGHPVAQAISIVDLVKEIHQALHENRSDFRVLPDERQVIAQELLLFENSGSDDLGDFTETQFRTARLTLRTPWVDALLYPAFVAEVRRDFTRILGEDMPFELTGGAALFTRIFSGVVRSMARSNVIALVVITPMMMLLVGDWRRGLASMVPNLIPLYAVLCLMGWADIPLDASTLMIGSILLGLAVDDTIHFIDKFKHYLEQTGDPRRAVHETLATTGTAMLFTSLVLCLGFAVFWAAYLNNTFWFGVLASFSTTVAFLADLVVGPALMVLLSPPRTQ
jgi:uncharacterized protein